MKYVLPFGIVLVFLCMWSLLMFPMAHTEPKEVPYGIVNLDQGLQTPQGSTNAGQALIDKVTAQAEDADGESSISWVAFSSEDELDQAFNNGELYGAVVIPSGFTQSQAMTAQGQDADATIQVIRDAQMNASLGTSLQSSLTSTLQNAGLSVETSTVHDVDLGNNSASSMITQITATPAYVMAMSTSMMIFMALRPKKGASTKERLSSLGKQIGFAAGVASLVACVIGVLATFVVELTLPVQTFAFVGIAAFCTMVLLLGAMNIAMPLGVALGFAGMAGMSVAMIAPEMLPSLWQTIVYPIAPQHYVAAGVNEIVYAGSSLWNSYTPNVLIYAGIGILLMAVSVAANAIFSNNKRPQEQEEKEVSPRSSFAPSMAS